MRARLLVNVYEQATSPGIVVSHIFNVFSGVSSYAVMTGIFGWSVEGSLLHSLALGGMILLGENVAKNRKRPGILQDFLDNWEKYFSDKAVPEGLPAGTSSVKQIE